MKKSSAQSFTTPDITRRNMLQSIGAMALSTAVGTPAQAQDPAPPDTAHEANNAQVLANDFLERSFVSGREYFVLSSGGIQLIVQRDTFDFAPAILWLAFDARKSTQSGKKSNALNFDGGAGFVRSALAVKLGGFEFTALGHETQAEWILLDGIPTVEARWWAGGIRIREQFQALKDNATFQRRIVLESKNMGGPEQIEVVLRLPSPSGKVQGSSLFSEQATSRIGFTTDHANKTLDPGNGILRVGPITLQPGETVSIDTYVYVEVLPATSVLASVSLSENFSRTQAAWKKASTLQTNDEALQHLYRNASFALSGMVADDGTMDAGIFEYGGQWVRDTSNTVVGLLHAGHFELARAALVHMFEKMIGNDGRTMIYGGFDETEREELDQMGELLLAIRAYVDWTGDEAFVRQYREKIVAAVNRPLDPRFRHSSGLVHGTREFWERTTSDGLETIYQVYLVLGLDCAISLSPLLGASASLTEKWRRTAAAVRDTAMHDAKFSIVANGRIIKRRSIDGRQTRELMTEMSIPDVPVNTERVHLAEPDAVTALPIALGFIDPQTEMAKHTLDFLEALWNARWFGGGYERYHSSSQPDQPGPWPFASCFILRAQHEARMYDRSRRTLEWMNSVQGGSTGGWFEEIPIVRSQAAKAGILPWTTAEITLFAIRHVIGVRFEDGRLSIRPNLYPNSPTVTADLRFRNTRLKLTSTGTHCDHALVNGQRVELDSSGSLRLPGDFSGGDIEFL